MDFELDLDNEKIQVEKDGKMVECDVLFTFDSEDTMKSYVGYTDHSMSNGRKNIYVSSYDPLKPTMELEDITDQKELDILHPTLKQLN